MQRGQVARLARPGAQDAADEDHDGSPENKEVAVEHQGFNLHAGVRIDAGARGSRATRCAPGVLGSSVSS
jgi:hypothetical protein